MDVFALNIKETAFRLELGTDEEGHEHIFLHGIVIGKIGCLLLSPY